MEKHEICDVIFNQYFKFEYIKKTANQPITASVAENPANKKGCDWLIGGFLIGTKIRGGPVKKNHPVYHHLHFHSILSLFWSLPPTMFHFNVKNYKRWTIFIFANILSVCQCLHLSRINSPAVEKCKNGITVK